LAAFTQPGEHLLQLKQVGGHTGEGGLGGLALLRDLAGLAAGLVQILIQRQNAQPLGVQLRQHLGQLLLGGLGLSPCLSHLLLETLKLAFQRLLLSEQTVVEILARQLPGDAGLQLALFPFLALAGQRLSGGLAGVLGLVGRLDGGLFDLGARSHLGLAVHNQQHQDQGPHRAQHDRKEGEGGYLEPCRGSSHAAFPSPPRPPGAGEALRAVSRWMAEVRLCTACSNVPVAASVSRFCCKAA